MAADAQPAVLSQRASARRGGEARRAPAHPPPGDVLRRGGVAVDHPEGPGQRREERDHPYGWGFAWYPAQTSSALVVKDPTSIGDNPLTKLLRDWERFASTVFLCHLRGAARSLQEQDAHPFSRSYAGRDWVLAHNGDLFGDLAQELPLATSPSSSPSATPTSTPSAG